MSDYLSKEVVLEILHRLPVKSLIRFRYCVHNPMVEHYKLIDDNNDSSSDQIQHIDFPLTSGGGNHFILIGSANGLFSLYEPDRYILWNPSIRKFIILPNPRITFESHGKIRSHSAFGFDPRTNDYKVVRIVFQNGTETSEAAKIPVVEIYSLNEGSWRITSAGNSFSPGFTFSYSDWIRPPASLNGAVHFVANDNRLILSFDLGDEVFRMIPVPNGAFGIGDYVITSVIGGSLSLICHDNLLDTKKCCSIWVMKEYGVVDSWTKEFTFDSIGGLLLCLQKNGNILVESQIYYHLPCEISSYDPKSKQIKNLGIFGSSYKSFADNYMENLVLLDKPNDTVSQGE
nr:F-box protein CPR1-like isoform X2 [Quercus suber]